MIYLADILTPANTSVINPLVTRLPVTKGLIYHIRVYMPHGAMGLHGGAIYDGSYQIWPSTQGTFFRGDGLDMDFDDLYIKNIAPYELQIKTWNLDDTYEHLIMLYISLVSNEAFISRFMPGESYDKMLQVITDMTEKQEVEKAEIIKNAFKFLEL